MWFIAIIVGIFIINAIFSSNKKKPSATSNFTRQKNPTSNKVNTISKNVFRTKNKLPDNLIITDEFKKAFDLLETTNKCAYITGKAGTGKSTLLTYFRQKTKKNIIVLAPTGIAAINVEGATIHSFFRFAPQLIEFQNITKDYTRQDLFNKVEMIIIDEISMVRADLLDGIDYSLRKNRNNDAPFGGVQMIFFGDLYQLPPVVPGKDLLDYFEEHFGGFYFFNAKVFKRIEFDYRELRTIFRQKDESFKDILNGIRESSVSIEQLNLLNQRFNPNHTLRSDDVCLTLSTTNKIAEDINRERMDSLPTKQY